MILLSSPLKNDPPETHGKHIFFSKLKKSVISFCRRRTSLKANNHHLQSVSWILAEFRHNKIVQSPHENYFNLCRQHKEKWDLVKMTIIQTGR